MHHAILSSCRQTVTTTTAKAKETTRVTQSSELLHLENDENVGRNTDRQELKTRGNGPSRVAIEICVQVSLLVSYGMMVIASEKPRST
jgi:hypothetical protein